MKGKLIAYGIRKRKALVSKRAAVFIWGSWDNINKLFIFDIGSSGFPCTRGWLDSRYNRTVAVSIGSFRVGLPSGSA